jgi:hypothetical protein
MTEKYKRHIQKRFYISLDKESLDDNDIISVIDVFNRIINLSHNNGWWFNKIASESVLDMAAKTPGLTAAAAAPFYFELCKLAEKTIKVPATFNMIRMKNLYFFDQTRGAVAMLVSSERPGFAVLRAQGGMKRTVKLRLNKQQKESVRKKLSSSKNGKLYLAPQANGAFKLIDTVITPPIALNGAQ